MVKKTAMSDLNTIDVINNYIFLQTDLTRSKLLSYAIDPASNKLYLIHKKLLTFDIGIFLVDKSDFQYNKIMSSLDKFYHQINLQSSNTVHSK